MSAIPAEGLEEGVQWILHGAEDLLCTQYEGEIWFLTDNFPIPINDTHPNCACELVRVEIVTDFPVADPVKRSPLTK